MTTPTTTTPINITLGAGGGGATSQIYSIPGTGQNYNTVYSVANTMAVHSGMNVDGNINATDLTIDGMSVKETLEKIQDRLAILVPDPAKLEKYEALQAAYNQYKMLERLIGDD